MWKISCSTVRLMKIRHCKKPIVYVCERAIKKFYEKNESDFRISGRSHFSYAFSFSRSASVMPSKKSSIILSSLSHMGLVWQHSVLWQEEAP